MILRSALSAVLLFSCLSAHAMTQADAPAAATAAPSTVAPADPAQAGSTPAAPPAAATAGPDEQVCKVQREVGSNRLKRVCRSRAQIEREREASRDALSREQR